MDMREGGLDTLVHRVLPEKGARAWRDDFLARCLVRRGFGGRGVLPALQPRDDSFVILVHVFTRALLAPSTLDTGLGVLLRG